MSSIDRRSALASLASLATLAAAPAAWAQAAFPSKPIRLIVPFPAGGGTDIIARPLAAQLSRDLGVQVMVENRPGAGGMTGASQVVQAPADGHTLVMTVGSPIIINPVVYAKVPYDPLTQLAGVAQVSTMPVALAVPANSPANNLREFAELARRQNTPVSFGSTGLGSASHIIGQAVGRRLKVDMNHIPFQGSAPAITALMGGHVSAVLADMAAVMSHLEGGRLKIIAVTGDHPAKALPKVATFEEQGVKGLRLSWVAVLGPAGVPPAVLARLSQAIGRAVATPELTDLIVRGGMEPMASTPAAMDQRVREDLASWRALVQEIGGVTIE